METSDNKEHDVFLKPSAAPGLDVEGLRCEALAASLAGLLDLPICEPLFVELHPDWIASLPTGDVRAILEQSNPVAFGSVAAGEGWHPWLASDRVTLDRRATARAILAFDAFIENPDRRPDNPNLLVKNSAFRIIDHEMALRIRMLFPRPEPWKLGGLAWLGQPNGHALAAQLKGTSVLDLADVRSAWTAISDGDLDLCQDARPDQWAAADNGAAVALTHVRAVRDTIDDCLAEIERVLT